MATDAHHRQLTAEEFLRIDFGPDMKAELDNGVIRMMAGGTRDHARVQGNLFRFLGNSLRGSGCRPYGSYMAIRTHGTSVRYPDLTVDCGGAADTGRDLILSDPRVVIEILSPSTREHDLRIKKEEYRAIDTVDTIVFADVDAEAVSVHQRDRGRLDRDAVRVARHRPALAHPHHPTRRDLRPRLNDRP